MKSLKFSRHFKTLNSLRFVSPHNCYILPQSSHYSQQQQQQQVEFKSNVTQTVQEKIPRKLHLQSQHPLCLIREKVQEYFRDVETMHFDFFDDLPETITTEQNFDELLFEKDHVSRGPSDTYYVEQDKVLRTHMTAFSPRLIRDHSTSFLSCGDVYRRDEVDATHYPVFHQIDGVRLVTREEYEQNKQGDETFEEYTSRNLKETLEGLARHLFGDVKMKWSEDFFPFTDPSYELEIEFNGKDLEVLGCGLFRQGLMRQAGYNDERQDVIPWAFGLGLERLAMILFDIPDIRLFWSEDPRFQSQFDEHGMDTKFKPYSKYPPCLKDIAFWIPENYHDNEFFEIIRNVGGDLIESVEVIDKFHHPKKDQTSICYRINYRSMDRSLTNDEINVLQSQVIEQTVEQLGCELRDGSKV